jgi:hypothetical protein
MQKVQNRLQFQNIVVGKISKKPWPPRRDQSNERVTMSGCKVKEKFEAIR